MRTKWLALTVALLGLAVYAPSVQASLVGTTITTGDSGVAVPSATLPAGTIIASQTETISTSDLSGTLYVGVFQESSNNTLDFIYQVVMNSSSADGMGRLTASDFTGFSTSVAYLTTSPGGIFSTGSVAPNNADRNTDDVVGFNFSPALPKGDTSYTMVIGTIATSYTTGNVGIIDGVTENLNGYAPTVSVPEPSSMAMAGLGALGLIGYGLRRRKSA